jgi:hypothetical protein
MEPLGVDTESAPPAERAASARRTVHLGTLMLLIALIAVCLGVFRLAPGLGVLFLILIVPALVRTILSAGQQEDRGHPMSWDEKLLTFFGSVGVVAVLGLAASIAFLVACFSSGVTILAMGSVGPGGSWLSASALVIAPVAGLAVAVVVIRSLARQLWP